MTTENLNVLKIHRLSKEQFKIALENGLINPNELYLTPDTSTTIHYGSGLPSDDLGEDGDLYILL